MRSQVISLFPTESYNGGKGPVVQTTNERGLGDEFDSAKGTSSRTSKGRLNLLNPMSLLTRRRSSQNEKLEEPRMTINTLPVPAMPDDYDPRIRGHIVHDFSAPRPRRQISYDSSIASSSRPSQQYPPGAAPWERKSSNSPEKAPAFKEDFSDDAANLQPGSTGYLHSFAAASAIPPPDRDPPALPAFARALPSRIPERSNTIDKRLPALPELESSATSPVHNTTQPASPPRARPSGVESSKHASVLPKHMASNASRFSFDMSGIGSAVQEKLLEEKHRQKEAARQADFNVEDEDAAELDDYENYGFDDDDGLEEKIPGVNADADDSDQIGQLGMGLHQFHFSPSLPSALLSPSTQGSGVGSFPTPRDEFGQAIGFAVSKTSPDYQGHFPHLQPDRDGLSESEGLGITSVDFPPKDHAVLASGGNLLDEDMYFDDGDIDLGMDDSEHAAFDESVFDDENGQIHDIPAQNAKKFEEAKSLTQVPLLQTAGLSGSGAQPFATVGSVKEAGKSQGLTEDNMAIFQEALLNAANEAAAEEELAAAMSEPGFDDRESVSQNDESHPGLTSDGSRLSHSAEPLSSNNLAGEYDFDADDLDDDLLIAEANGQALENDDEGFYGREFGFYAKSHPKTDAEMVNGGYFIPRGMEGVHRSHSGRANFQEPSLTPITERSEWSTRNSLASIHAFGVPQSAHSMTSPGIADLLGQGNLDEDLSLSALLKLRRGAWGGSQTSLHSSAASQTSNSPNVHSIPSNNLPFPVDGPTQMTSSSYSLSGTGGIPESEEEDEDDYDASPTITQGTPQKSRRPSQPQAAYLPMVTSPLSQHPERPKAHSRQSSGADSVSYSKDAEGRFIIERKRTLDSGEIELIGREVLVGTI